MSEQAKPRYELQPRLDPGGDFTRLQDNSTGTMYAIPTSIATKIVAALNAAADPDPDPDPWVEKWRNTATGLLARAEAVERERDALKAEVERLRAALEFYASGPVSVIARAALAANEKAAEH